MQIELDPAHSRAVAIFGFAAGGLALICLELMRWRYQTQLTAAGFAPWGDGFYVRDIPGHSLSVTSLQLHIMLLLAVFPVGITAAVLSGVAAMLDMRMPFIMVSAATLLGVLLLPMSGLLIYIFVQNPACLTVDLSQGFVYVAPSQAGFSLANLAQFEAYATGSGKTRHVVLGATLTSGEEEDLLSLYAPVDEGQRLAQALQGFVSSGGTVFPAS